MLMLIVVLVLIIDMGMLPFFLPNLLSCYVLQGNPVIIENLLSILRDNPFF